MSAITRLAVSANGRNIVMRLAQPSSMAVRSFQTSKAASDIDSGIPFHFLKTNNFTK